MVPLLFALLSFFSVPPEPDIVLVRDEGDISTTESRYEEVLGWRRVASGEVPDGAEVAPDLRLELLDRHPSDEPLFVDQWALPLVGADRAWEESLGAREVVVAVIDSGVQLDHPDLAARLAVNPGEIPENGRDDDGNGLVDDVVGWDVIEDDNEPTDPTEGHGTEVAGVLAASVNGQGVAGLAPETSILPIRACTQSCQVFDVMWAIEYAVDRGAQIINLSLGQEVDQLGEVAPLEDAITYAEENGVLVVAAAGNQGIDIDETAFVPAGFPHENVVAVAATTRDDRLWEESNYGGGTVDLAAPGVDIATTTLAGLGGYRTVTGTSFAAPHVAASAALMLAVRPDLTPPEIVTRLIQDGTELADLEGRTVAGTRLRADAPLVRARLSDVGGVYEDDILWLALEKITRGCNPPRNDRYCPDQPVTRAQMAAFLHRALHLPPGPDAFTDDDHTIYAPHIDALAHAGITHGCNPPHNDRYCPDQPVTRAQMAAFLHRALR